jgi:1,3-beta-glucan synthase
MTAELGGRLHYGHPDFVRFTFCSTTGGVSRGQKGLHLNEDIFLGMNAFMRGGGIIHTEYFQCGKGRDLGFASILGFVSKIGGGMGEQMLSREHFYLGCLLPWDRFLTFYFAHPGFHLNNVLSLAAIFLFALLLFFVGVVETNETATKALSGWLEHSVIAILLTTVISYTPFIGQVTAEFGFKSALNRILNQFTSLTPVFEVFATRIYAYSMMKIGLSLGNAQYIATGRGLSHHLRFHELYSGFAHGSIYFGFELLVLLLCAALSGVAQVWIAFFMSVSAALIMAPFIFNAHQFDIPQLITDYAQFWRWLFDDGVKSWVDYHRQNRSLYTGNSSDAGSSVKLRRNNRFVLFFQEVCDLSVLIVILAYIYSRDRLSESLLTLGAGCFGPFAVNFVIVVSSFVFNIVIGNTLGLYGRVSTALQKASLFMLRTSSLLVFVGMFYGGWMLEGWNLSKALILWIAMHHVHVMMIRFIFVIVLRSEHRPRICHRAFLSGRWVGNGLGFRVIWLVVRECLCKTVEQMCFPYDMMMGHVILFALAPLTLVPGIDEYHTRMLFWNDTKLASLPSIPRTTSEDCQYRRDLVVYSVVFLVMFGIFVGLVITPLLLRLPKF